MMRSERFYKNHLLDFAELRYSRHSTVPFKPHMHHTLSIGAVDQGEVLYTVNREEARLAPGSLIVINPETLHACNPATDSGRSYYMLHLDTDWCFKVQQSIWKINQMVAVAKTRIDDVPLYTQYCRTMEHLIDTRIHLQEKEQMLYDLVVGVFSVACKPQKIRKAPKGNIEKLKELLSEDLQRDLPLTSLAKAMGVNPYALIRSFKAATGLTPHAFRMSCRIEQARALLRQGWDIAETALECGFCDQSHFHRYFKAITTVTPQEYRINFIQ